MPPILTTSGTMMPRQFGPMMRAPRSSASSTIWATSRRGIRSVTITISLISFSSASNTASFVNAGRAVRLARVGRRGGRRRAPFDPLDGAAGGLVQRHRAVRVLDAVALEDLEALLLPRTGDAEDRDLLRRVEPQLQAGFDHAARDD